MKEKNSIGNIHSVESGNSFGIKSENSPFAESFYFADFYDDKAIKRFIKSVEKLVRTSREYKTYIEALRTNILALNHDSILGNITTADVDLEFHHYPFSLYEITETIMLYHVVKKENFTSFSIAKEIMDIHNEHLVGLVPLTKTTHELVHLGQLFISKSQVFGNYSKFIEKYSEGVSLDIKNKIASMEEYSNSNVPSDFKGLL